MQTIAETCSIYPVISLKIVFFFFPSSFFYFIVLNFDPVLTYNIISVLQIKDAWSDILLLNVFKTRVKQTCKFTKCLFVQNLVEVDLSCLFCMWIYQTEVL